MSSYNVANEPPKSAAPTSAPRGKELSEAEFLQAEMKRTQAAMQTALHDLRGSCSTAADVRLWTKKYPWAAVGLAAGAGFATAALLTPSREKRPRQRASDFADHVKSGGDSKAPDEVKSAGLLGGLMGMLMGPLMSLATTFARQYIMQLMHPQSTPPSPADGDSADAYSEDAVAHGVRMD